MVGVAVGETVVVVPEVGQFLGKSIGCWLSCFIPLMYSADAGKGTVTLVSVGDLGGFVG